MLKVKKTAKSRRSIFRKHVHNRLLIQLRIFIFIASIMLAIVLYDLYTGVSGLGLAILGIIIGLMIGFILGKFVGMKWHEDDKQVISRMDRLGLAAIVVYICFSLFRRQLFGQFIHGPALTAITFASVGGIMMGRMLAIVGNITKILKEQRIL